VRVAKGQLELEGPSAGGKQRGKCRECREELADGNTAGQQADDSVEQGHAGGAWERGRQRQRESAPQRGRRKCEHNRQRNKCKDCGGASICEHNRIRSRCKDCGGASICEHNRIRSPSTPPRTARVWWAPAVYVGRWAPAVCPPYTAGATILAVLGGVGPTILAVLGGGGVPSLLAFL